MGSNAAVRGGFKFGLIAIGHCRGIVSATGGLDGTDSLVSAAFEGGGDGVV